MPHKRGNKIRPYLGVGCGVVLSFEWGELRHGVDYDFETVHLRALGGIRFWISEWAAIYGEGKISTDFLSDFGLALSTGYGFMLFLPPRKQ